MNDLRSVAKQLASPPYITVAADESPSTMGKRFDMYHIENSFENRLAWRVRIADSPIAKAGAGSIILHPEMLVPEVVDPLKAQGLLLIVKIDGGLDQFNGSDVEQVTKYAKDTPDLLSKYREAGCVATKFRSVFTITHSTPTEECIQANGLVQATLAKLSQDAGLVPMVESEVLRIGPHNLAVCKDVTARVLAGVYDEVVKAGVDLPASILKPNMVTPGKDSSEEVTPEQVAQTTLDCLWKVVPPDVAGVNFLSGGLEEKAIVYLNAIVQLAKRERGEEKYGASFGRAALNNGLKVYASDPGNPEAVERALTEAINRCSLARQGKLAAA